LLKSAAKPLALELRPLFVIKVTPLNKTISAWFIALPSALLQINVINPAGEMRPHFN
jgi:hypothetical protein